MTKDLTPKNLAERIAEKRAEEVAILTSNWEKLRELAKREYESTKSEYESYGSKLRASVRAEGERTRSVIEGDLRELRTGIARKLLWSLTIGMLLVAGVALGSWGLISFLSRDIQHKIETRQELAAQIEQQSETLKQLQAGTWGIDLRQMSNGRFVVLPPSTIEDPPWTVDGRPAIRLSSE